MKNNILALMSAFTLLFFSLSPMTYADDAQLLSMIKNLEGQMKDMQKTINWQKDKIRAIENKKPEVKIVQSGTSEEDYFKENLEQYIGDSHKWLKGLKFYGDLRLRYEALNENGAAEAADRNRFRYRLRFGFEKKMEGPFEDDKVKLGFRLVSAGAGGRDSTNTTLDTGFSYKAVSIDRAFASYYPGWGKVGPIKKTEITAGKFKNPFREGSSWMIWDSDVTPEGAYQKIWIDLLDGEDLDLGLNLTAGQLILEEGSGIDHDDAELFAYQATLNSKISGIFEKPLKTKHAFSFYNFNDYNLPGNFPAAGNNITGTGNQATRLASGFNVINIYNEIGLPSIKFLPKSKIYFDWAKNIGNAANDAQGRGRDKAWMLGYKLGKAKKKGSWEVKYEYAWIEANASPDAFNDSDFGGTDRRGSVIKAGYALTDHLKLKFAYFATNRISTGDSFNGVSDVERDLFQTDLVWKF